MKALTLHRPWPNAIFKYGKDIENRSWPPPLSVIGRQIAIHAGKAVDGAGIVKLLEIERGAEAAFAMDAHRLAGNPQEIVGVVTIKGYILITRTGLKMSCHLDPSELAVMSSSWFSGPYGWVLSNPQLLKKPISCKGYQRLWNVPSDIAQRIYDDTWR